MTIRLKKLVGLLEKFGLAGVALNPGPSLTYLTGLNFHLMERPVLFIITQAGRIAMVLPELEKGKLTGDPAKLPAFTYGDDPATWPAVFERAVERLELHRGNLGVEPTRMRFLELSFLQGSLPGMTVIDASQVMGKLRWIKTSQEVSRMKQAAQIAQAALLATLNTLQGRMTEKAIANELVIQLLRAGSDPTLPFTPIVAIGENSANPHAQPTERALKPGDLLLVDWGASYEGYFSDITRTFTYGEVDPELVKIGNIVLAANRAGRAAGKPGVAAGDVDLAARSVIAAAGYGDAFIHRTGHGLGMEAHEPPYIFTENEQALLPGMTFTIEPGIYLPGKGGIRIEDDVVITKEGLKSLTDLPRQVLPIEDYMG